MYYLLCTFSRLFLLELAHVLHEHLPIQNAAAIVAAWGTDDDGEGR